MEVDKPNGNAATEIPLSSPVTQEKLKRLICAEFMVISDTRRRIKAQKVSKFMNDMAEQRPALFAAIQSIYKENAIEDQPELQFFTNLNRRPAKSCSVNDHGNHRQTAPLFLFSSSETIPACRTWCTLPKNLFIEDQRELPYLPYFENEDGDSSTFLSELLEQQYEGRFHNTPVLALPAEQNKETLTELFQKILSPPFRNKIGPLEQLPGVILEALPDLQWNNTQLTDLMNQIVNSKPDSSAVCLPNIDGPDAEQSAPDRALNSYMMLFCSRCFRYDCHLHPYLVPQNSDRPKIQPALCEEDAPCSPLCYKLSIPEQINGHSNDIKSEPANSPGKSPSRKRNSHSAVLDSEENPTKKWSNGELTAMRVMALHVFGADYCKLSQVLFKPCIEVYQVAERDDLLGFLASSMSNHQNGLEEDGQNEQPISSGGNSKRKASSSKSSGKAWLKKLWNLQKRTQQSAEQNGQARAGASNGMANPYEPCSACGDRCEPATCKCHLNGNFCEKFCHCKPEQCQYRFPGCRCEICLSSRCPCFAANRECDPDLCRTCHQPSYNCQTADFDLNKYYAEPQCRNVSIQRSQRKRLLAAPSDIAGWGCFLRDAVEKNEFIAEYVGELITQEEAERRGRVYDRIGMSFLFNLNSDYAVDAMRKGNKIRFANHSRQPNCYARVMLVNGDHRIGIYAKRAIAAGEELFFDYFYNRDQMKFVSVERSNERAAASNSAASQAAATLAGAAGYSADSKII